MATSEDYEYKLKKENYLQAFDQRYIFLLENIEISEIFIGHLRQESILDRMVIDQLAQVCNYYSVSHYDVTRNIRTCTF